MAFSRFVDLFSDIVYGFLRYELNGLICDSFGVIFPWTIDKAWPWQVLSDQIFDLAQHYLFQLLHCFALQVILRNQSTHFSPEPVFSIPNVIFLHNVQAVGSLLLDAQKSFLVNHLCNRWKVLEWNHLIWILWLAVFHCKVSHPARTIFHKFGPRRAIQSHQMICRLQSCQHNCTNVAAPQFIHYALLISRKFVRSEMEQTVLKHFHSILKRHRVGALIDLVLVKLAVYHRLDAISESDLQLVLCHQLISFLSLRNLLSSLKFIWNLAIVSLIDVL